MKAEAYEPYPKSAIKPLLYCVATAAFVAILSVHISTIVVVQNGVLRVLPTVLRLVPSVASISSETMNWEASEIVLLTQWLFAPAYLIIWFYTAPPWTQRMHRTVLLTKRTLTPAKRYIALPLGVVFLGAWVLGDVGVIDFPTFYNGKYAYPLNHAVPQVKLIYGSPIALAIYAWLGPLCEVAVIWMLSMLLVNGKTYASPAAA
jgi:hypothetical protein